MKASMIYHWLMKLVLRFDKKKLEKFRFQKMIHEFFHKSFWYFFLECNSSWAIDEGNASWSLYISIQLLAWWQLWSFIVRQVKYKMFLHPNEPPQMIFFISCKMTWGRTIKNRAQFYWIRFLKMNEIENDFNEIWSPNLIFWYKNRFQED